MPLPFFNGDIAAFLLTDALHTRKITNRAVWFFGAEMDFIGMSSNGRTADSGSVSEGSTPSIPAKR